MYTNTTGSRNTTLGYKTMYDNATGSDNVAVGYQALYNNEYAENTGVGVEAAYNNYAGQFSTYVGYRAGYGAASSHGGYNTFVGHAAGYSQTTSTYNVFLGKNAGFANTTGSYNIFIGAHTANNNTIGANNTMVGYQAGYTGGGKDGCVHIGHKAGYAETASNTLYINNDDSAAAYSLIYGSFSPNPYVNVRGKLSVNAVNPGGALPGTNLTVVGTSLLDGDVEITGDLTLDGNLESGGLIYSIPGTIADNDATPDVSGANLFVYAGSANAVTITDLDSPVVGAIYTIIGNSDTYTITIADSGNFKLAGASAVLGIDDVLTLYCHADNYYVEISRSNN